MRFKKTSYLFSGLMLVVTSLTFLLARSVAAHTVSQEGVSVIHMDGGFDPKEVTIKQGETVIFENIGKDRHWPASNIHPTHRLYPGSGIEKCGTDEEERIFDACRGLNPGGSYSFTLNKPGLWRFHDHLIPSHKGSVTVIGAGDSSQLNDTEETWQKEGLVKRIISYLKELMNTISLRVFNKSVLSEEKEVEGYNYDNQISEDSRDVFVSDDALYSYIKKYGPSATTKHLASFGLSFGDCHNRAHETGRLAYQIYDVEAFQTCSAECHSGCYHGATEGFFREHGTDSLAENLKIICSTDLNPFFSHQCIHGIGHGLMAWSDYEIHIALENCDLLDKQNDSCYSGVFMENIVGGLAEGHDTRFLSDDPHYPCNVVDEAYKPACYFYQTSRMVYLFTGDFTKVAAACSEVDEQYRRACFESMGRDVGGAYRGNPEGAIAACGAAPQGNPRLGCLAGAVQDSFWDPPGQDIAISFCRLLEDSGQKDVCYQTIFGRAVQVLGSVDELKSFCSKAESKYRVACLSYIK